MLAVRRQPVSPRTAPNQVEACPRARAPHVHEQQLRLIDTNNARKTVDERFGVEAVDQSQDPHAYFRIVNGS
jgi:hypothetical protein